MKKLLVACLASLGFMLCFSANAMAELKIGVVDMMSAIEQTEKDGVIKRLKSETEKRQNKLKASERKLLQFKQEIEESAAVLSEDKLREKAGQYQQMMLDLQREMQTYEQEMLDMRTKLLGDVQTKMGKISTDIARERGFDLLIERNEGGVIFVKPSFDVTDELIKRYKAAK